METIKRTYQEVGEFSDAARRYLQSNPQESKLRYALNRTLKSVTRLMAEYRDKVDEINIKHCLAADDGKGEILRDDRGQYKFVKDAMLKRNAEVTKLMHSEVELEVHFATQLPDDLPISDRESFLGFVIRDDGESATNLEVVVS
jgi:hypothetical protein